MRTADTPYVFRRTQMSAMRISTAPNARLPRREHAHARIGPSLLRLRLIGLIVANENLMIRRWAACIRFELRLK